ncbi:BrnA antitoxin family protein [Agaribacterium haliotis]|uniref:BrnA antitoxin family protein n=1 Tax=Agaribacterium haliotis TaxID=2013869 RepID=UPI000BB58CEA|nr:BrnA antitoxin family protein [Agaribacterium haliotis]
MNKSQKVRGKQKEPVKISITIRLDADLVELLRGSGRGWQTRVNAALRQHYLCNHTVFPSSGGILATPINSKSTASPAKLNFFAGESRSA